MYCFYPCKSLLHRIFYLILFLSFIIVFLTHSEWAVFVSKYYFFRSLVTWIYYHNKNLLKRWWLIDIETCKHIPCMNVVQIENKSIILNILRTLTLACALLILCFYLLKVTDDDFQLFPRLCSTAARQKALKLPWRPFPLLVKTLTQFLQLKRQERLTSQRLILQNMKKKNHFLCTWNMYLSKKPCL